MAKLYDLSISLGSELMDVLLINRQNVINCSISKKHFEATATFDSVKKTIYIARKEVDT